MRLPWSCTLSQCLDSSNAPSPMLGQALGQARSLRWNCPRFQAAYVSQWRRERPPNRGKRWPQPRRAVDQHHSAPQGIDNLRTVSALGIMGNARPPAPPSRSTSINGAGRAASIPGCIQVSTRMVRQRRSSSRVKPLRRPGSGSSRRSPTAHSTNTGARELGTPGKRPCGAPIACCRPRSRRADQNAFAARGSIYGRPWTTSTLRIWISRFTA
jgi:hypothetical protein